MTMETTENTKLHLSYLTFCFANLCADVDKKVRGAPRKKIMGLFGVKIWKLLGIFKVIYREIFYNKSFGIGETPPHVGKIPKYSPIFSEAFP